MHVPGSYEGQAVSIMIRILIIEVFNLILVP